jgi:hypothetical protein
MRCCADLSRAPKLVWIGKPTDVNPQTQAFAHIFRTNPLPLAPPSFSSIVLSQPPPLPPALIKKLETENALSSLDTSSISEGEIDYQEYDWEEAHIQAENKRAVGPEDWIEAKRKPGKKIVPAASGGGGGGRGRDRGSRRALAGTGTGNSTAIDANGREKRSKRGGRGKRDSSNVRELKPRPCHSHYLSK